MKEYLTYQQISLVPRHSNLDSRVHADTRVNFLGRDFILPIVPANMKSVIDTGLARKMSTANMFYIMHRNGTSVRGWPITREFLRTANEEGWKTISISVGVNKDSREDLEWAKANGYKAHFVTIDVAHGHHDKVKGMICWIKEHFPCSLIAGNVTTAAAKNFLIDSGADCVKIGIGQGSICTTRYETGFGLPMFSTLLECIQTKTFLSPFNQERPNKFCPTIADGGIQRVGDVSKALVAGATMVMAGGLFASCIDSPAEIVNGKKQYHGSTSFAVKKENKNIEGKTVELTASDTYLNRIKDIRMSLQSAISYAGGKDLSAFEQVDWVRVNNG